MPVAIMALSPHKGLRGWLTANGVTMVAFAKKAGVTHSTVSRWCTGEVFPRGKKLVAIHRQTNGAVSADDFLPTGQG